MREDEVYVSAKSWFRKNGFTPIAGQPPSGCDNIPTVEIKDFQNRSKGSRGSFKPDLIVANSKYFIVVECKPLDSPADELKLIEVDSDRNRLGRFYEEIVQRGILSRRRMDIFYGDIEEFMRKVRYCLAHAGRPRAMDRVMTLLLTSVEGEGQMFEPADPRYRIRP